MAVYRARLFVRDDAIVGDNLWSVNFHVISLTGASDAWDDANAFGVALGGNVLTPDESIYLINVKQTYPTPGAGLTKAATITGARSVTGDVLPQWNTVRVTWSNSGFTRPSIQYLRCGLTEDDVVGQNIGSPLLAAVGGFVGAVIGIGSICNPIGNLWTDGSVDDLVAMRQLGWHRHTRPGFHRGYVPD